MSIWQSFVWVLAFIFAALAVAKGVALDAKLDPEEGKDETRVVKIDARANRSFCRRWLRAANYREGNIVRALDGKPVDNCPRLTRAKRNLLRSLTEDRGQSVERMKNWRETGDNLQNELALQRARREIEAEIKFHATVTIDDVECERAIIAADGEGMDGGPDYVMFSFNYDVTMLLKGLRQGRSKHWHYERVWEICKRQDLDTRKVRNNTIYIGNYAISYINRR